MGPTRGTDNQERVVAVGAGNTGTSLLAYLARLLAIVELVIIDFDVYQPKNIWGQNVSLDDVGRLKAQAQADHLRRINPNLRVVPVCERVENVPMGLLRGGAIFSCVDRRSARRWLNEAACRLGVPLIDLAVQADNLLARVSIYHAGPESACLECAWDEGDYALLDVSYPCDHAGTEAPATDAPAELGGLAASWAALQYRKLCCGNTDGLLVGQELLVDARYNRCQVTKLRRNPSCRFDHARFDVVPFGRPPDGVTLGELLGAAAGGQGEGEATLSPVGGKQFVTDLVCLACRVHRNVLSLQDRLVPAEATCPKCGLVMVPTGFSMQNEIRASLISDRHLSRTLAEIGFRQFDMFAVTRNGSVTFYEIGREERT